MSVPDNTSSRGSQFGEFGTYVRQQISIAKLTPGLPWGSLFGLWSCDGACGGRPNCSDTRAAADGRPAPTAGTAANPSQRSSLSRWQRRDPRMPAAQLLVGRCSHHAIRATCAYRSAYVVSPLRLGRFSIISPGVYVVGLIHSGYNTYTFSFGCWHRTGYMAYKRLEGMRQPSTVD